MKAVKKGKEADMRNGGGGGGGEGLKRRETNAKFRFH